MDRIHSNKVLCENYALPRLFVENIYESGVDRLMLVKYAVQERLKTRNVVTSSDGQLDTSIFD